MRCVTASLVAALLGRLVGCTSLLRQVMDMSDEALSLDPEEVDSYHRHLSALHLVDSNMTYLESLVDMEIATASDVLNATRRVVEEEPKRRVWLFRMRFDGGQGSQNPKSTPHPREFRVGRYASPTVDPFCEFVKRIGPAIRRAGRQYALLSVGTHGLGSPFHPSIRKQLRESEACAGLKTTADLTRFVAETKGLKAWFVTQHWPTPLDAPGCPNQQALNRWDPGKGIWEMGWSLGRCPSRNKMISLPLGLPGSLLAKSLAFAHVFKALRRTVIEGARRTKVTTPWDAIKILQFERAGDDVHRPHLITSAMRLHKGRAAKLDSMASGLRAPLPNTPTSERRALQNYTDFVEYYKTIAASKFVFSPVGSGLDCFRHWEAMALGAVPIVDYSPVAAELFRGLPVLLVDDFDTTPLSQADLLRWYEDRVLFATSAPFDLDKLTKRFWIDSIANVLDSDQTDDTVGVSTRPTSYFRPASPARRDGNFPKRHDQCRTPPFLAVCLDRWGDEGQVAKFLKTTTAFRLETAPKTGNFTNKSCKKPVIVDNLSNLPRLFKGYNEASWWRTATQSTKQLVLGW